MFANSLAGQSASSFNTHGVGRSLQMRGGGSAGLKSDAAHSAQIGIRNRSRINHRTEANCRPWRVLHDPRIIAPSAPRLSQHKTMCCAGCSSRGRSTPKISPAFPNSTNFAICMNHAGMWALTTMRSFSGYKTDETRPVPVASVYIKTGFPGRYVILRAIGSFEIEIRHGKTPFNAAFNFLGDRRVLAAI